jgi:hypothetical protein
MLQSLIIGWSNENLSIQLPTKQIRVTKMSRKRFETTNLLRRVTRVQHLIAAQLIATLMQFTTDLLDRSSGERSGIAFLATQRRHFAHQTLDQLSDGHARRNGVRVDDNVWRHTLEHRFIAIKKVSIDDNACACVCYFDCPWHVFLSISHADGSFLSMTRREFIAYNTKNKRHLSENNQ